MEFQKTPITHSRQSPPNHRIFSSSPHSQSIHTYLQLPGCLLGAHHSSHALTRKFHPSHSLPPVYMPASWTLPRINSNSSSSTSCYVIFMDCSASITFYPVRITFYLVVVLGVAYNVYLARIHTHVHACIRPCFAPFGMHSSSLICTAFYSFYISSNLIGLIYRSVLLYFDVYLRLCAETFLNLKVSNIIR